MDQWVCGPLLAYPYVLECAGSGFIHPIVYLLNIYYVPCFKHWDPICKGPCPLEHIL